MARLITEHLAQQQLPAPVHSVSLQSLVTELLVDSAAALRSEVLSLKHDILSHGACDFPPIQSYIASAASRIT